MAIVKRSSGSSLPTLSDFFNRFFEGWDMIPTGGERLWLPALDVAEREDSILVKAEVPGMKAEDIDVSVQGNLLVLSGEKKESREEKGAEYYQTERRYGSFRREVTLPGYVDADRIDATYENGVLTIHLPKSEEAKPKKIKVRERELETASH